MHMRNENGPVIDMTADGRFVEPSKLSLVQIALRLAAFGVALLVGAVLISTAFIVIPVLLVLGGLGYMLVRGHRLGWRAF